MSALLKRFFLLFIWWPMLIIFAIAVVMVGLITMVDGQGRPDQTQKLIEKENKTFFENKAQWEQQVANTPRDGTNPKFIVLKEIWIETWSPIYTAFVYDESNEIASTRGLHLPFWKSQVSHAGESSQTAMGHIFSRHLEGHFFWITDDRAGNGYALERHGSDYKIIKWNCSTFIEPITMACPDQWQVTVSGGIIATYNNPRPRPPNK